MKQRFADYLEQGRGLNMSAHTLRTLRYNLSSFLDWMESYRITAPDQLRRAHLSAWLTYLQQRRTSRGLPLKASSINRKIECVRGFLGYLAAEGLVPLAMAGAVGYVKEPKLLPGGVMTHSQMRKLLRSVRTDSAFGYRDRAMLEMLCFTGIRAGELLGLDVAHLDLKDATALVYGKGRKQRVVPMGKTALRYMQSYLKAVRPFLLRDRSEQAAFLDAQGRRLPYHVFRRLVQRHVRAAGFEGNITAHTFRRSCTTELLRSGANMYHVKELLGHESLDTLRHYARLTITDLRETHRRCHPRERGDS